MADFENIKKEIAQATLKSIDEGVPFVVKCDALEIAISATLNQGGRPVAFMSWALQSSELHYPAVEKEATAIIEAVRKWNHLLSRQHFTLVTDQRSVSFILDNRKRTKIKSNKIQCWRLELASHSYTIKYRLGKDNAAADSLTRAFAIRVLLGFYISSVQRTYHFPQMTFVKCALTAAFVLNLSSSFYKPIGAQLIQATKPFERISIDYKGPVPSTSHNKYLLVIIDEYSRFHLSLFQHELIDGNCLLK